jgi:hypothetical protein
MDIAHSSSEKDIYAFINEFKEIDKVQSFFNNNNDFRILLIETLPRIANTLDKTQVLNQLNIFFNESKNDLYILANDNNQNNLIESKASIFKNIFNFCNALINKENTEIFLKSTKKLEIIQADEKLVAVFNSLNSNELNSDDRYSIMKKLFEWLYLGDELIDNEKDYEIKDYLELMKF